MWKVTKERKRKRMKMEGRQRRNYKGGKKRRGMK
jgi:hypothetical protein